VKHVEDTFAGAGGRLIFWRAWLPDSAPGGVVVIAHGVSEHSGRYTHVGEWLAGAGYATYALDHRGHGRSHGSRAMLERLDRAVADLDTIIGVARGRHDGAPVFLLGHSMGGAVALQYALDHDGLAGLVLSGPAAALETASPVTRAIARVLSAVTPSLGVFALDSADISRDAAVVRDYDSDPLVHRGKVPARTVAELAAAIVRFPSRLGGLTVPVLVMHGGDDRLVPVAAATMVHERAGSPDKTLKVYDGLYHEILNEPEREAVMDDLVAWLDARVRRA
jgi:acylglycerol lipase